MAPSVTDVSQGVVTVSVKATKTGSADLTCGDVTIAAKFSQVVYNGGNSFADTPESHWAARFISLAENQGWVNGYPDGTFKPDQRITRTEAITLINRVLERATETGHMAEEMVPGPTILPEPGTTKRFRRQPTLISTCV
ncbi:MAG: S-layer homology domain-containing protein [Firmicutes bacterium]|nr:S-layer homology domain-containing protein [Bacillota bacterium]